MHGLASFLKTTALELGFADSGLWQVQEVDKSHQQAYQQWLDKGHHAQMAYMERNQALRFNPERLMPGAKSVLTVLLNYYPAQKMPRRHNYRLSKYAYGQDYHHVIKNKLQVLAQKAIERFGTFDYRAFTDSAPIPDAYWAQKVGLGKRGKNTLLIHRQHGSFVFIGHLFMSVELPPDKPAAAQDICKDCDRCLRACPSQALYAPGMLDANRCISYQTIENKSDIKGLAPDSFHHWIYGCDICQDVCPYNANLSPHTHAELQAKPQLMSLDKQAWQQMSPMAFGELFRGSAVKRVGYQGLRRNMAWVDKKEQDE